MLMLTLCKDESVFTFVKSTRQEVLLFPVAIYVCKLSADKVALGFEADDHVAIVREEVASHYQKNQILEMQDRIDQRYAHDKPRTLRYPLLMTDVLDGEDDAHPA